MRVDPTLSAATPASGTRAGRGIARATRVIGPLRARWAGLVLVAAVALVSQVAATHIKVVSALLIAIALGVLLRNTSGVPTWARPGVNFSTRAWLRCGVVLLGFQLSLPQVAALGWGGIGVIVATVAITYASTLGLGRVLRVPALLTRLVATGFSICGAAAIAASSGVVDPDGEHEDDTATAVALVTLYGTVMIGVMPALAGALGLPAKHAGMWMGASIHEVAQVVAASTIAGGAALAVATVTKLGRVVLLAPLVFGQSLMQARRVRAVDLPALAHSAHGSVPAASTPTTSSSSGSRTKRPPLVPGFVVGFLAAVLLRSTGWLPGQVLHIIALVTTFLLTGAMFCLGTGVDVRSLVRTGGRAAILGLASTLVAVATSGIAIAILHP